MDIPKPANIEIIQTVCGDSCVFIGRRTTFCIGEPLSVVVGDVLIHTAQILRRLTALANAADLAIDVRIFLIKDILRC